MSTSSVDVGGVVARALPTGIATGVGTYVASYVVLFVFLAIEGGDMAQAQAWKAAGFIFYNAHNVAVTATVFGQTQSANYLARGSGFTIPVVVYYLVPALLLVLAGYLVASIVDVGSDLVAGVLAGVSITVGYLVLAIAGTFLFAVGPISPDLVMGAFVAGLVYPVVFGGIGGALAGATS